MVGQKAPARSRILSGSTSIRPGLAGGDIASVTGGTSGGATAGAGTADPSATCGAGSASGLIPTAAKPVIAASSICLRQV